MYHSYGYDHTNQLKCALLQETNIEINTQSAAKFPKTSAAISKNAI